MRGLIRFIKNLFYSIPFGMKGGDLILNQKTSLNSDNTSIINFKTSENLGEKLLKCEVDQEVEELRHMTYKVSEEAKKYKYIGDGEARKVNTPKKNLNNYSFSFENKIVCSGVVDELLRVGDYGTETYTVNIIPNVVPRFKIESFCNRVDVKVIDNKAEIYLHFSKYPNKYDKKTKSFLNELDRINKNKNEYTFRSNEICSSIEQLSFVTFNIEGEEDGMYYIFKGLSCIGFDEERHEYIIRYQPNEFTYENLLEKFKSATLEEKYLNKAPKSDAANFTYEKSKYQNN